MSLDQFYMRAGRVFANEEDEDEPKLYEELEATEDSSTDEEQKQQINNILRSLLARRLMIHYGELFLEIEKIISKQSQYPPDEYQRVVQSVYARSIKTLDELPKDEPVLVATITGAKHYLTKLAEQIPENA